MQKFKHIKLFKKRVKEILNLDIKHTQALELLAAAEGHANYNIHQASSKNLRETHLIAKKSLNEKEVEYLIYRACGRACGLVANSHINPVKVSPREYALSALEGHDHHGAIVLDFISQMEEELDIVDLDEELTEYRESNKARLHKKNSAKLSIQHKGKTIHFEYCLHYKIDTWQSYFIQIFTETVARCFFDLSHSKQTGDKDE